MTSEGPRKDLVVLVPCRNLYFSIDGMLGRPEALGIRPPSVDIFVHPHRDPGCLGEGHDFLRPFTRQYRYSLVVLDRDGCGRESLAREQLEEQIEQRLSANGWSDRRSAIVIDPELEAWVWSDSPQVDHVFGWENRHPDLRSWLRQQGMLGDSAMKPGQPKEAVEAALRVTKKPRSSSLYYQLAQRVSLRRCTDPAFEKLARTLRAWFPQPRG